MTVEGAVRMPTTLAEAAERLYQPLIAKALEEAADFDDVDTEIALLRLWLAETAREGAREHKGDNDSEDGRDNSREKELIAKLFNQIVRAVAVKYRLGPKRGTQFAAAMQAFADYFDNEVLAPADDEEDV